MHRRLLIAGLVLVSGCASSSAPPQTSTRPAYVDKPSSALVFDLPVQEGRPGVFLARDDRQPGAFAGYEDLSATFFFIQSDDRPGDINEGWLYRRAVITRTGTSYR